jgi:aquaporin-4
MVAVHRKAAAGFAGIAIGGMIFLLHLVGVPLTGASMNPARTFGPALVSGHWDFHWIYWAGPIVGALIAAFIMNYIFVKKAEKEETEAPRAEKAL